MMARLDRFWHVLREHRRRIATLVAVVGVLLVGGRIFEAVPREVSVEYRLPMHANVDEIQIAYFHEQDEVAGVRFDRPGRTLTHTLELSPGRYRVEAVIRGATRQVVRRALRVPADGVVHIDLDQSRVEAGGAR